jgi:hypothetical protein
MTMLMKFKKGGHSAALFCLRGLCLKLVEYPVRSMRDAAIMFGAQHGKGVTGAGPVS